LELRHYKRNATAAQKETCSASQTRAARLL
jgi:hypothetical protein